MQKKLGEKPIKMTTEPILLTGKTGTSEEDKVIALYNTTLEEAPHVFRSFASNIYQDIYSPNISIKDGMDRLDYDFLRPSERIPIDEKGKIAACLAVYEESGMGIIRNIIDLMADLVVQGIDVVHPKLKNEKFAKRWFHHTVKGPNFSERFVNMLCRSGNNIVKRDTNIISLKQVRQFYKGIGKGDDSDVNAGMQNSRPFGSTPGFNQQTDDKESALDERFQRSNEDGDKVIDKELDTGLQTQTMIIKREIPVHYNLLNPLFIDIYSPELAMFIDNTDIQFGLAVPMETVRKIQNPLSDHDKALINLMPESIVQSIRKSNSSMIPLDSNKIDAYYYKKDDWKIWATPMMYGILSDLYHLRKMKMADLCALDGALSQIRIWKIGDLERKIRPTISSMNRLANILMQSVAGGILELIWGPDLQCQELDPKSYQFLGQSKYEPVLNAIYSGLGVPPLFTGVTASGSFTANFLAIKTFIVRLEYLRDRLRSFWGKELNLLAKALDWDEPAQLVFDRMTLNDEASILQIMLNMVDRGILSDEHMQDMIGAVPNIEKTRLKREMQARKKKKTEPKAGPYHKDHVSSWIDNFIKMGEVTPSQVGIELDKPKKGEKTPNQSKVDLGILGPDSKKMPPIGRGGRPIGKKDSIKRKSKNVKVQRGVGNIQEFTKRVLWASEAQDKISEFLTPKYLELKCKKNLRQLTVDEFNEFEDFKFGVLANIATDGAGDTTDTDIEGQVKDSNIEELITQGETETPEMMGIMYGEMLKNYEKDNGIPSVEIKRKLQCLCYASFTGSFDSYPLDNQDSACTCGGDQTSESGHFDECPVHKGWLENGGFNTF